jgi:adhesin transport system outer membrane protein
MACREIRTALAAGSLLLATAAPAEAISLTEAVQKALTEHPKVAAAGQQLTASEYRLQQSRADLLPTVDLEADAGKQFVDRPESLSGDANARWLPRR